MKRILTLLTLLTLGLHLMAQGRTEIHVHNLVEFINAIKSNRTIIVDNDIDFGNGLERLHQQQPRLLPELYTYDNEELLATMKDQCFIEPNTDGYQLYIKGVHDLTIKGVPDRLTLLRIVPRYCYVLSFLDCQNIRVEGLTMGHTEEGYCDGGVLNFEQCQGVEVDHCDLYGCGKEGICCVGSGQVKMTHSYIRNCSYDILTLVSSHDISFEDCFFFDNRQFELLEIRGCEAVSFERCHITNNQGTLFSVSDSEVVMRDCIINHPDVYDSCYMSGVRFDHCLMGDNHGVSQRED